VKGTADMDNRGLIEKLDAEKALSKPEWMQLIGTYTDEDRAFAADMAREIAVSRFGRNIFFRGIVEFTNICKNDCLYCGIRRDNTEVARYRLSKDDILACCRSGYGAGFRTFVLQGGEDPWYTDEIMADIVAAIRGEFPDCAITLSIGEKTRESYQMFFDAGANRYLLRHETANAEHYRRMHPADQTFENRMRCLRDLKDIGYQTGCGMMAGAPYQTVECLADDMLFMRGFEPAMIGMGPFIPHHQTPFRDFPAGGKELTLMLLSLCRIMLPDVLLPATTALGTVSGDGRKLGVLAGANVIMPNLSPPANRKNYMLYDNKAITGEDAAESLNVLQGHLDEIGYKLVVSRGDYKEARI
jgi:biotin synthase